MTTVNRPSRPHRPYRGFTDDWLTPPWIFDRLGAFDLDPCTPEAMPWKTAKVMYSRDGLSRDWVGRVWLNPPYGPLAEAFMERMVFHDQGTALVFARTETQWFYDTVWDAACAVLFLKGRLHFHDLSGRPANGNAGGPSVLVAYGAADAAILHRSGIEGHYINLWEQRGQ